MHKRIIDTLINLKNKLERENQQIKLHQNSKAVSEYVSLLKEIHKWFDENKGIKKRTSKEFNRQLKLYETREKQLKNQIKLHDKSMSQKSFDKYFMNQQIIKEVEYLLYRIENGI